MVGAQVRPGNDHLQFQNTDVNTEDLDSDPGEVAPSGPTSEHQHAPALDRHSGEEYWCMVGSPHQKLMLQLVIGSMGCMQAEAHCLPAPDEHQTEGLRHVSDRPWACFWGHGGVLKESTDLITFDQYVC